jgi:hypothetical protein
VGDACDRVVRMRDGTIREVRAVGATAPPPTEAPVSEPVLVGSGA